MKKRADNLLQRKVSVKGHKPHVVYGHSKPELDRKEKEYKESLNKKPPVDFEYWLDKWWENHQTEIKYNTYDGYKRPVEDVREYFKGQDMREIKPSDITRFLEWLAKADKAKQTVKLRYIVIKMVFDYAMAHDMDIGNPAAAVKLPKGLKADKRQALTDTEISDVKASKNLLANTLLYTGLRLNEALALRWIDIDMKQDKIYIRGAIVWQNNKPVIDTPKTENAIREIPLLPELKELLKPGRGYVFSENGKPLEKKQFRSMWDKYCKELGWHITPHQFRHTYATTLYYAGIDLKTAQYIMGHAKPDMMLEVYTHLKEQQVSKVGKKISKQMSK